MHEKPNSRFENLGTKSFAKIGKSIIFAAPIAFGLHLWKQEEDKNVTQYLENPKPVTSSPAEGENHQQSVETKEEPEEVAQEQILTQEQIEPVKLGERFEEILISKTMINMIPRNEVIFTDEYGAATGDSVKLDAAAGYTPYEMTVSYEDGDPVGIPGVWSKHARTQIADRYDVDPDRLSMNHVYLDLEKYPKLETRLDVIKYNVEHLQLAGDERNPIEYILQEFSLAEVPSHIATSITNLMPGLVAQESRYKNVKSKAGASSYFQTMNDTQSDYEKRAGKKINVNDFMAQMPVAEYQLKVSYIHLTEHLSEELEYVTETYFAGNRQQMEVQFLVPLIINSYNAGQGNMTKVVKWFFANYTSPEQVMDTLNVEVVQGYDLFTAVAFETAKSGAVPHYQQHASNYFFDVAGFDMAIDNFAPELLGPDGTRLGGTFTLAADSQSDALPDQPEQL